jgi:hypothetical protein
VLVFCELRDASAVVDHEVPGSKYVRVVGGRNENVVASGHSFLLTDYCA